MSNKFIIALITVFSFALLSFTVNNSTEWTKMLDKNGVVVSQKIAKCATQHNSTKNDYFVFKYNNTNNYDVRITYKIEYWIGDKCRSCNLNSPNEYEISIDITAGQTLEYTCNDDNKGFKLYKSTKGVNEDSNIRFEFVNVEVNKI